MQETKIKGVYKKKNNLLTLNLTPGKSVYHEKVIKSEGNEYREWNPNRSKLAAALKKGASQIGIKPGNIILYLGASTGTTPSHVSDIVGKEGFIYALDFAPRVVRELVFLSEDRKNIAPILGDAKQPLSYSHRVSKVDSVYQDIAQHDQVEIFLRNCDMFLEKGGFGLLCVKSRSIDVTKKPKQVFAEVRQKLEKALTVVDYRELAPFEKDHCIYICKKK